MSSSNKTHARRLLDLVLIGLLTLFLPLPGVAQAPSASEPVVPAASQAAPGSANDTQVAARLADVRERIGDKENELKALRAEARKLPAGASDPDLQSRINEANAQLQQLRASFEQLAVDGLDMSVFRAEAPKNYDWQSELLEIARPLLSSLKDITEKPRRIEALRREIERAGEQINAADKALVSINGLLTADPGKSVVDSLKALQAEWKSRRAEIVSNRELFRVQLARLEEQAAVGWESYLQPLGEFVAGRGLTLLYAIGAAFVMWLLTRLLLSVALRVSRQRKGRPSGSRERAARYLYRGLSILLIMLAMVVVFYARSDMLLLALAILLLIMSAAALRQAIPRYISEIRMLMGFGPVRESERLIYDGVPMRVVSINAFAVFANPELTGYHRVPLQKLEDLQSRPVTDEPWFPASTGDFLMLSGDRFVEVLGQSVERVRLRHKGSEMLMPTSELASAAPLNLTRDGFVVPVTFGVDYALQPISLDEVPTKMEAALAQAIAISDHGAHLRSLLVTFSSASAHSLDYLIVASFDGAAAGGYFAIGRLIQQTLVAVCNREGWSIPFEQLTVHLPQAPGSQGGADEPGDGRPGGQRPVGPRPGPT
ncbi:MAG: hypothetical protein R3E87_14285 [Burkholderiaceae bacterium]